MKKNTQRMFALILSELNREAPDDALFVGMTAADWDEILAAAKRNDVGHLIADAALRYFPTVGAELTERFKKLKFRALSRQVRSETCLKRCAEILSQAQIPFLPLKGSVLRRFYPEPWMRTGSDIDFLVPEAKFEQAVQAFSLCEDYRLKNTTPHDLSFTLKQKIVIELHHSLIEPGRIGTAERLLDEVWDYAEPEDGYAYRLRDEMFYYYHLAHMAKHVERGGCGIRPLIDLWVLNRRLPANPKREELLDRGGLRPFADAAVSLCEYWFGGREADENTLLFGDFILQGGVYGSKDNEVLVKSANHHGKWGYMLHKVWMPYPFLCCQYPGLKGRRALLPIYEARRWMRIVLKGNVGFAKQELDHLNRVSDQMQDAEKLWRYLGF